ncbi:T9SS type A sorting domain-containing protein [Flavobacterium wongokense]|uniref:T9SS type A sorting domain-containing protein n=1 Tax=Flavobacterium wongokense TaxID=2910674 RepID=UPI001F18193D|nr:T9SS type A sorting domain-containing protein [Flavobacterium sp. WG47]MCF6131163.1 T9SS type A sorting domain-containing protein [Flavobacterium sp. WG47]
MKKIYSLLLLVVSYASFGQTVYTENMGTPTATTSIATNVFQNTAPIVYSGTADVRNTLVSSGYTGASAGGNVFINAVDEYFQIDGINTSAFNTSGLQLSFGVNTPTAVTNVLLVDVSTDATNWTPLTYTPSATGWTLATITSGIPQSATLSIRFKSTSTAQYRVDDVKVFNLNASCTLVLGTPTTVCNDVTQGIDTYTTSITYTGGGSGSYTITPTAGTVGGDNPATVAAGTILINGVSEGTNITVNIVSGPCSYQANVTAPQCKPVNPLPYYEPFAYAEASSLGNSQQWTNNNTGDNIIVAGGALLPAYPGLTPSTTGYANYGGDGIDCSTAFTPQSTGTVYYSFLLNVNSMAGVTDVNGGYIATFGSNATTLGGTLWTKRVDDGVYNLGIEVRTATGANTTWTTDSYVNFQTVFVVVGYTFGASASDDTVSLWVNPTINAAQPAATITDTHTGTDLATISTFLLRQDSTTETPSLNVDELRIGTTWAQVTGGTLGTSQNTIAGLKMYPNPVSNGTLFIETTANAERTVTVFDVLGKQVLNTKTSDNAVNVSSLHTGVYIVNITEEGKTATRKLVIK